MAPYKVSETAEKNRLDVSRSVLLADKSSGLIDIGTSKPHRNTD